MIDFLHMVQKMSSLLLYNIPLYQLNVRTFLELTSTVGRDRPIAKYKIKNVNQNQHRLKPDHLKDKQFYASYIRWQKQSTKAVSLLTG